MDLVTYSAIKTKIENDLDLIDEDFISETEFLGYCNEALNDAESVIHTLGLEAQYFLTTANLTLVSGTSDYAYPSDIYAMKIRKMFYINGSTKYRIDRIRELDVVPFIQAGEEYSYLPVNLTAGPRIRFYPAPAEAGAYIQVWYIRNLRTLTTSTASTNTCEIPECINFLLQHVKWRCLEKEGHPNTQEAFGYVKVQHDLMIQTLQEMVPDEDTLAIPDLSHYADSNLNWGRY